MPPPVQAPPAIGLRRGHERVGAVVEVEQRALGALEQDVLAAGQGVLDQPGRVGEVVAQAPAPAERLLDERRRARSSAPPIAPRSSVLLGQDAGEPLAQDASGSSRSSMRRPSAPGAVVVGRPDPPAGRPDLRPPRRASLPRSSATWYGMITWARG